MKLLYISGPFGDDDPIHGVGRNIITASRVALAGWRAGWAVICPHKNTAGFQHAADVPWSTWMAGDIAILRRCDAILMLPDWEASRGACIEREAAMKAGLKVLYYRGGEIPRPDEVIR